MVPKLCGHVKKYPCKNTLYATSLFLSVGKAAFDHNELFDSRLDLEHVFWLSNQRLYITSFVYLTKRLLTQYS
jgi:hypothetical protein